VAKLPESGATLNGMVKSYNRKGFGFIMCLGGAPGTQDIYYSRENLHVSLQTRDIPGEHVTFEIQRFHDGKLVAKNIRPVGGSMDDFRSAPSQPAYHQGGKGAASGGAPRMMAPKGSGADEEDRTRDWKCEKCAERNFMKRFECFKCHTRKPFDAEGGDLPPPRRTFSPHAGSRGSKESLLAGRAAGGNRGRSRSARRSSGSSSSSSSRSRKKKKKEKKSKRKKSSSSGSSSSRSSRSRSKKDEAEVDASAEAQEPKNPEVEQAKAESLQKLMKLRDIENFQARMKEYRELLRQWHPDKNPDKVEVATAVFQFLQKAKPMIGDK